MPKPVPSTTSVSRVPKYRRHKPTGQAVVTLNGRDIYLGKWNTKQSWAEYNRLTGEWLAAGRCRPTPEMDLTVAELGVRYLRFAQGYYRKNGEATSTVDMVRRAIWWIRQDYGHTFAAKFGPVALEALQTKMIAADLSRNTINETVATIRRMFRWGTAKELVPAGVLQALTAVSGLRKGRTPAREPEPVRPVSDDVVDRTLPHLPKIVADMVRFERFTGCRPEEACTIRPCDVDTSGDVWLYRPASHKTQHHDRDRVIAIGPRAQDVLRPYLLRDKKAFCFVPTESERKRNSARRENRVTPMTPSQAKRRPKHHRRRPPGTRYSTDSYRRAIQRGCELANRGKPPSEQIPKWTPNQLRHTAATEIRRTFGLEAAQVALGHAAADVTQIYAEKNQALAVEVMRKIG